MKKKALSPIELVLETAPPAPASASTKPAKVELAAQALAEAIAHAAWDKRARRLAILDVAEIAGYTDFCVLCSGTSDRHVTAIANAVEETLREHYRIKPLITEGVREGRWAILDYEDVIFHVQQEPVREFYALDKLWAEAPQVELTPPEWVLEAEAPSES